MQLFSVSGTCPPSMSSELEQLPSPKIDHNSWSHLPKDITSRHTQKSN